MYKKAHKWVKFFVFLLKMEINFKNSKIQRGQSNTFFVKTYLDF